MNYIVAVSGGVDSVALLHMVVTTHLLQGPSLQRSGEVIVAHFDHGIRPDSASDARFVEALAKQYTLPFEHRREELGESASELVARERRYAFLKHVAKKHNAIIVTAHHLDDLVESVAINFERGTGWRGLAVLNTEGIERPLLSMTKKDVYDYALQHNLEWVEDETNRTDAYHRNRVRSRTHGIGLEVKQKIANLRSMQVELTNAIEHESHQLIAKWKQKRYPYIQIDQPEAMELVRYSTRARLTRPQQKAVWMAIKVARAGSIHQSGNGVRIEFSLDEFRVAMV